MDDLCTSKINLKKLLKKLNSTGNEADELL